MNMVYVMLFMFFFAILNSVSAVNVGYIGALNDYIGSVSVGAGDGTLTIPIDPAGNDGFIEKRNDGTAIINIFHSCNDQPASAKSWPNKGLKTNSKLNWVLEGGVKYQDVTSAHAGIRGAYFFNGSTGYTRVGTTSVSDDSYKDLLTGANAINTSSATFELWVRAHASDLTQFSTLFECGGGTGTGIAIDNGVLVVANNIAKGKVTYNLLTDPQKCAD
ncbi:MAG: hypothetical protein PHO37_14295 [Kiritimatiellae bacterium]|nr:hypothetical protein [Kiritimatiellia bacterium]